MNTILGVDGFEGREEPTAAEALLRRLQFPVCTIDVVNVLTPLPFRAWGFDNGAYMAESIELQEGAVREAGDALVQATTTRLKKKEANRVPPVAVRPRTPFYGSAVEGLLGEAEKHRADLIALDGPHQGLLGAFLSGSVARALVIDSGSRSLLLAKRSPAESGKPMPKDSSIAESSAPVRVVFATDHSAYADRCLEQLIRFNPRGISYLTVLTAFPQHDLSTMGHWMPDLAIDPALAVRQALEAKNNAVLDRLAPILDADGAFGRSEVSSLPVNDAIAATMRETRADLLILGARGHGLFDRLTIGSVSFQQAMTSPYSVLILRV